ncbi:sigma-70 family RNA polymerase sigma factor [Streptomyces sp. NPDC051104]|uniref:RNA polymerase sigma factor n=1 Tax=Streptomyces sp. NPDC051104 TaxID=3155044 RepID=UPI0034147FC3
MATDMPAETGAARDAETHAAHDRWKRMWSHREHLLKVARRRSMSLEDAEDAVHEAMLRAAERPDLDDERLGAWLTTVTMRLCVDRYRQVNREAEVRSSPTLLTPGPVPVDEAVCDRAEARWLAVRSGELPARQAEALRLKSEDLDVSQVAVRMGLSYRTVESLLARARRTLRASLAGTLGAVLFLLGRGRPRGAGKAQTVAVTSTAATLVVAGFVLPQTLGGGGGATQAPVPRPAVTHSAQALRTDSTESTERLRTPRTRTASHRTRTPAGRETARTPGTGSPLSLSVPSLPEVSSAPLPTLSAPGIPGVPTVPKLPVPSATPSLPSVPTGIPSLPSASLPVPTPSAPSVKLP